MSTTTADHPVDEELRQLIRRTTCGVIEMADEQLVRVRPRSFARHASRIEVALWGPLVHRRRAGNRCWLYYHQPRQCRNFLALDYVISTQAATLATFRGALGVLDEIAELKGIDALVCDVAATRISDRLLARWGWEPHAPSRWHRHHIKRFYGQYPASERHIAQLCDRAR